MDLIDTLQITVLVKRVSLLSLILVTSSVAADNSLRGERAVTDDSAQAEIKHWQEDKHPITREYLQQPPLIPHAIESYKINLKFNKCLTCHSWANYQETGATKISHTHFVNRDGEVLENVSARRYFCPQCHVPQVNAKPLVGNQFKPVRALTGKK